MHDMGKRAKLDVLKELRKAAMDDMGEGMQGHMKKVTVAAPDTEHLKEGLHKAEDMMEEMPESEEVDDSYEAETEQKLQELVDHCKSPEDLDKKIAFLQRAKEEKFGSSEAEME